MAGEPPRAAFLDYAVNLRMARDCAGPARFYRVDLGSAGTR